MPTIQIFDNPGTDLEALLDQFPDVDRLGWAVLEMWAVARDDQFDLGALVEGAEASPSGLEMSASELRQLGAALLQLVDGIVVGYIGPPPPKSVGDLRDVAEIVIEAVDSTYWTVFARDPEVVERLHREYQDVRYVDPEVPISPTHKKS